MKHATDLNICDSLPYYQPYTIAGAINLVFNAYPQKYENCSTLVDAQIYKNVIAVLSRLQSAPLSLQVLLGAQYSLAVYSKRRYTKKDQLYEFFCCC
jgi:hypothetical protein